jgi:hypothetical protein
MRPKKENSDNKFLLKVKNLENQAGREASVVEHLSSKGKHLSSENQPNRSF